MIWLSTIHIWPRRMLIAHCEPVTCAVTRFLSDLTLFLSGCEMLPTAPRHGSLTVMEELPYVPADPARSIFPLAFSHIHPATKRGPRPCRPHQSVVSLPSHFCSHSWRLFYSGCGGQRLPGMWRTPSRHSWNVAVAGWRGASRWLCALELRRPPLRPGLSPGWRPITKIAMTLYPLSHCPAIVGAGHNRLQSNKKKSNSLSRVRHVGSRLEWLAVPLSPRLVGRGGGLYLSFDRSKMKAGIATTLCIALPWSVSCITTEEIFHGPDRSAVSNVRVTSCSTDFGQKQGRARMLKSTVLKVEPIGFL